MPKGLKALFVIYPWMPQFIKYVLIGGFSASVDVTAFYFMRLLLIPLYAANFLGTNLGISISFLLNARFNFKKTNKMALRGVKFFCVGYLGILLSTLLLYIGVDILGIPELLIKIGSVFFIAVVQFTLNKLFSFN